MTDTQVPEARTGAETWRYVTRCCESVQWAKRTGGQAIKGKDYPAGQRGKEMRARDRKRRYRCGVCGEYDTHLRDKKTDAPAKP